MSEQSAGGNALDQQEKKSQESGENAREEVHHGDLAIKAIVPEKVQHDVKEEIAIIFNHCLNVKTKDSFVVDFVGSAGRVQVPARLVNSSTLMLETPGYREPSVVTAHVYQGIHRRLLGQHRFEFLSRTDSLYRLLYGEQDPINFMCEALKISPADIHDLDAALAETFKSKAPDGFDFIGTHTEGTGTSDAEHPTLLHFACEFGLTQLIRVLLRYPGAHEACSMKNCHNVRSYHIAENHGFDQLANELRAFHDRCDPDPYITMGEKDEDLYVRMQKEDGPYYYYVLKRGGNLYADVEGNEENEDNEHYVKMAKEDGGHYYVPMKEGVGHKQYGKTNNQGYINIAEHNQLHDGEAIYTEDLSSGNDGQEGEELYEDVDHNINPANDEQLYVKVDQDGNPRNLSAGDSDHDEQFYEDMNPEGNDVPEEVYTDMQPAATDYYAELYMSIQGLEQTPDSFGYVKPTSNRPFSQDAVLFNRSASTAAAIRAKQLENERKTQSLPAGRSQAEVMKRFIEQNVKSGKLTDEVASQMMEQLGLSPPPPEIMPRRGSTSSKATAATTSTCSSGSSGIGSLTSESELIHHQEPIDVADEDEEEIHVSRDETMRELRKTKGVNDAPTPVLQPDYDQKDKIPGRSRKLHSRFKTSPVEEKDIRGILNKIATAPQPPPVVKRRQTSPSTGSVSSFQPKDCQPIPEFAQPPKTTPRPAARKPVPTPRFASRKLLPTPSSDSSRPGPVVAPSERLPASIEQSGVPVLPIPQVKGGLPTDIVDNSPRTHANILTGIVTREGGVVGGEEVKLVCPPGAVDKPLHVTITLEEPSKYYGLIVQKDLENDVMLGAPVVKLQPNGHVFKKPATLTTKFKRKNFRSDDVLILNGTEARDGQITWEDMTRTSTLSILDDTTVRVSIEVEHFSLIVALFRMTLSRTKDILSCLNLLGFNYMMSLLLYKNCLSTLNDELALVFVSQDVYNEQFYKEHETSSLVQLKTEGFRELHVRFVDGQEAKRIYNSERLQVSVHLGDDYSLGNSEHGHISFTVCSHVWWNMGEVIRIPMKRTKDIGDARILCGMISVQGEYGHTSERHFCEIDLCGYVRSLLEVEKDVFNLKPIAQKLKTPDELVNQITKSLKDEDENLDMILQHWLKENDVVEDLSVLRKHLEDLQEKDYKVTQRGQMHVRHLTEFAIKISRSLQSENAELMKYFCCKTQILCRTVLRDCCIELEGSAEGVQAASSCTSHVGYLEIHRPIPKDIAGKCRLICSSSRESSVQHFLAIAPFLIQITKDIFLVDGISDVQNGLKGLPEETLAQFVLNVQDAEQNKAVLRLVCEICKILEQLCLKNCGKQPTSTIEKWGKKLGIICMMDFLKPFFQYCPQDVRLHKRLEFFSECLRDIMSGQVDITDEMFIRDFSNVSLSLIHFAKFDPTKLVRFELTDSAKSPVRCHSENIKYDSCSDTFFQQFCIKKELEDELELQAIAYVHVYGRISKKGAFMLDIMINASDEETFDRCMFRFAEVCVTKREDKDSGNILVVLCSTQKEKLSEVLAVIKRELSEDLVKLRRSEVTKCPLKMHTLGTKAGAVLSLRLVYKWGSDAIALESKDFVTLADSSAGGACIPEVQLVGVDDSLTAEDAALSLAAADGNFTLGAFDQLQKYGQIQCEKIEYHVHQTVNNMSGHVCVAGDKTTLTEQMPSQRALQEGPSSSPMRKITDGKKYQEWGPCEDRS